MGAQHPTRRNTALFRHISHSFTRQALGHDPLFAKATEQAQKRRIAIDDIVEAIKPRLGYVRGKCRRLNGSWSSLAVDGGAFSLLSGVAGVAPACAFAHHDPWLFVGSDSIEDLRTPKVFGAWLEVGDERFNSTEIQRR